MKYLSSIDCRTKRRTTNKIRYYLQLFEMQPKSLHDNLESLRMELRCSVCLSTLKFPCSLPCNHFFCGNCVDGILKANNNRSQCPLCKHPFNRRTIAVDPILRTLIDTFRIIYNQLSITLGGEELSQQPTQHALSREIQRNKEIQAKFASSLQFDDEDLADLKKHTPSEEKPEPKRKSQKRKEPLNLKADDGLDINLWSPYHEYPFDLENRCSVCLEEGELLQCIHCNVKVHGECYGVEDGSDGLVCDPCQEQVEGELRCVLCPNKRDKAYKKTTENKWVHVICALWHAGPEFSGNGFKGPVAKINAIKKSRSQLLCMFCKTKDGFCLQCCDSKCKKCFHASCGLYEGLRFELRPDEQDKMYFHQFCEDHFESCHHIPSNNHDVPKKRSRSKPTRNSRELKVLKRGVILSTQLKRTQQMQIDAFCKQFGYSTAKQMSKDVTHLITPALASEGGMLEDRTIKCIKAFGMKQWIICFDWIASCLVAGTLLDCTDFQVKMHLGHPILSFEERTAIRNFPNVFERCLFLLPAVSEAVDMESIVKLCRGQVVYVTDDSVVEKDILGNEFNQLITIDFESRENKSLNIPFATKVKAKWVYDCIWRNSFLSQVQK